MGPYHALTLPLVTVLRLPCQMNVCRPASKEACRNRCVAWPMKYERFSSRPAVPCRTKPFQRYVAPSNAVNLPFVYAPTVESSKVPDRVGHPKPRQVVFLLFGSNFR